MQTNYAWEGATGGELQTRYLSVAEACEGVEQCKDCISHAENDERLIGVFGDYASDARCWHMQGEGMSCAVSCQEFVAEQLLGDEFSEGDLLSYARKRGWYNENTGTTASDVGKLLEDLGLQVDKVSGLRIDDLAMAIESGKKPICAVNNLVLINPQLAELPGYKANHVVEVIGVDASDSSDVKVVLNDPGVEGGGGMRVDEDTFMKAWGTSDCYAVIAYK